MTETIRIFPENVYVIELDSFGRAYHVTGENLLDALKSYFEENDAQSELASEVIRLTTKVGELSSDVEHWKSVAGDAEDDHASLRAHRDILIETVATLATLLRQRQPFLGSIKEY